MRALTGLLAFLLMLSAWAVEAATLPATPATLGAVLKTAKPGDLVALSGVGQAHLTAINIPAPGVRIEGQAGATILGFTVWSGVQGVTLAKVTLQPGASGAAIVASAGSGRLAFEDIDCHGADPAAPAGFCVEIRDNADAVSVTRLKAHDLLSGVKLVNAAQVTVQDSDFRRLASDAITGSTRGGVTIQRNTATDFLGAKVHLDFIQLYWSGQTTPICDVTIRDNIYTRGVGTPAQSVFLTDAPYGFCRVTITGNAFLGGSWWGVGLPKATDVVIRDNLFQGLTAPWPAVSTATETAQVIKPWIDVNGTRVGDPAYAAINDGVNRVVVDAGQIKPPADGDADLKRFLARNDDPRDAKIAELIAQLEAARKAAADAVAAAGDERVAREAADAAVDVLRARMASIAALAAP